MIPANLAPGTCLSDVVAERVSTWRRRRGWNRDALAVACADLGAPELTHAAITNIETGRRNHVGQRRRMVTVDEAAVLAAALRILPVMLTDPTWKAMEDEVGG